jgi:hypothetical protein
MINSGERGFGLPRFSHTERERRWSRVRELMRRDQIDAIIGFPNQSHWDQFQADIRYLTHIGGHQTEVAVVFPISGEVTAFVRGGNEIEWWPSLKIGCMRFARAAGPGANPLPSG